MLPIPNNKRQVFLGHDLKKGLLKAPLSLRLNDGYLPWLLGTLTVTIPVALLPAASRHSIVIV